MATVIDLAGLHKVRAGFHALTKVDATPLMLSWMKIIEEDNRKGILAGLDKDGRPMVPVTYRPRPTAIRTNKTQKLNQKGRVGGFFGLGMHISGKNNNLSSAEYRRLAGPPLAPRGGFSRVITNLRTEYGREGGRDWYAVGFWEEVVSVKGVPFLRYHFDGIGRLPRRDLRGLRPDGQQKARTAAQNWIRLAIREAFP